jgi:hypothetical protein
MSYRHLQGVSLGHGNEGVRRMHNNLTRDRHDVLMARMAATLGADLDDAELRGDLPPELREEMLSACTGCAQPGACAHWLGEHAQEDEAPAYCRNRTILHALAAE